ncbi:GntR family transcriptional regulator [Burkholderia sp. MR1-5-21]
MSEQIVLTKRQQAIARLKDAILEGQYRPGQSLRQMQLMSDLDLGATPVREAVLELASRGLLVHDTHLGMRVAELDRQRVRDTYSVRAVLESEAAALATQNATDENIVDLDRYTRQMESAFEQGDMRELRLADGRFHRTLYEAARNPVLLNLIEQMWEQFPRYMLWSDPDRVAASIVEHREIMERFRNRDAEGVASAVRTHLMHGLDAFEKILRLINP